MRVCSSHITKSSKQDDKPSGNFSPLNLLEEKLEKRSMCQKIKRSCRTVGVYMDVYIF